MNEFERVVKRLHKKGLNDPQIAKELGVRSSKVQQTRTKLGYKSMATKRKEENKLKKMEENIHKLYLRGYTDAEIAKKLKCIIKIIYGWRVRNNLPKIEKEEKEEKEELLKIERLRAKTEQLERRKTEQLERRKTEQLEQKMAMTNKKPKLKGKDKIAMINAVESKITDDDIKGKDSLYCDSKFLEIIFGKKLTEKECD